MLSMLIHVATKSRSKSGRVQWASRYIARTAFDNNGNRRWYCAE